MTLWPHNGEDRDSHEASASPPPAWEGLSARVAEAVDAPPIDPTSSSAPEPGSEADVDQPTSRSNPPFRKKARPVLTGVAIILSSALHAAVLAFFVDRMSRTGIEAETNAVSVEIVLEEPPQPTVAATGSAEPVPDAERDQSEAEQLETTETAVEPTESAGEPRGFPQQAEPTPNLAETAEAEPVAKTEEFAAAGEPDPAVDPVRNPVMPVLTKVPDQSPKEPGQPVLPAEDTPPLAKPAEDPAEVEPEFPPLPAVVAVAPSRKPLEPPVADLRGNDDPPQPEASAVSEFAEAPTPVFGAPLPSPRPSYKPAPKARPKPKAQPAARTIDTAENKPAKPAKPARKGAAAKAAPAKNASGKPAKREQQTRTTASAAGSTGAAGGASAGAEAKYGQKLLSHVQRHKRYPEAAARQKITGATRLAITIDRSGGLAGAKVAGGSGHSILDEAALDAARRAAPYPRPPQGVGGATFSFAVTMRFTR